MREIDVAIVGGGMAGATIAAMLGRRGVASVVFEPRTAGAPDFRCEKVDSGQLERLDRCGLGDVLRGSSTRNTSLWVGRGGRVVERLPYEQAAAPYEGMVGAMRGAVAAPAHLVAAKVTAVHPSTERQVVHLSDGSVWSARLVVVATGPSPRLVARLGFERTVLSAQHSVSIGFDLASRSPGGFPFESVTWFPERFDAATAYLTVFAMGPQSRANLFVYRRLGDPWLDTLRADPEAGLAELMPGFARLAGAFAVTSALRIRAVDLYETRRPRQPGLVLVGDAYSTSDPAAGTGFDKVWNDAYVLVERHISRWLASPGMGADKIRSFYDDPEKRACDAWCLERAYRSRSVAVSRAPYWRVHRRAAWAAQAVRGAVRG